jgi:hypothetical protein
VNLGVPVFDKQAAVKRRVATAIAGAALIGCSHRFDGPATTAGMDASLPRTDAEPVPVGAPLSPDAAAAQMGTGAKLTVTPNEHGFGQVFRGSWDWPVQTFEVRNVGNAATQPLLIVSQGPEGSVFTQPEGDGDCYRRLLAPDQSCSFKVEFAPANPYDPTGPKTNSYGVNDGRATATLIVSGTSLPAPAGTVLTIKPTQVDFGAAAAGSTGERRTFLVVNIGDKNAPTNLAVWGAGGDVGLFRELSSDCRAMIASHQKCVFTLEFAPPAGTSPGPKRATWAVGIPDHPTINVRTEVSAEVKQ